MCTKAPLQVYTPYLQPIKPPQYLIVREYKAAEFKGPGKSFWIFGSATDYKNHLNESRSHPYNPDSYADYRIQLPRFL